MEGTYEAELERAELLGIQPTDRELWEVQRKAQLEAERETQQAEIAQELQSEGENLKSGHGKMDELNSILSSTQAKLNTKFKGVCGSFTTLLKLRSGSATPEPNAAPAEPESSSINAALENLDQMKEIQQQSDMTFAKNQVSDLGQKASKNLDALDRLLMKTETAQMSMEQQNKQMKSYLRK